MCALYPMCNPGDQQVGMDCPAERECYTLSVSCGSGQYNTTTCAYGADAGVDANSSDARVDADTTDVGADGRTVVPPVAMAFSNRITVRNAMTATPTMVMGAMPSVRSKQAGSAQPQGSCAYPVAPMLCDAGPVGYCGDGVVETGEECDCGDGTISIPGGCVGPNNDNTYGGCTTKCTLGPRYGDGVVQMNYGEQCDLGSQNGVFQSGLGECTPYCQWIPWLP